MESMVDIFKQGWGAFKALAATLDLEPWPVLIVIAWVAMTRRMADAVNLNKFVEAWAAYVTEDFDNAVKDVFWGACTMVWAALVGWLTTGVCGFKATCAAGLMYGTGAILIYEGLRWTGLAEKLWLKRKKD
jgi:hypothetical protein